MGIYGELMENLWHLQDGAPKIAQLTKVAEFYGLW